MLLGTLRGRRFFLAASVRAVQHLVPVFGPGFAPRHISPAHGAGFAGQALFVAFETGFHGAIVASSCRGLQGCWIMPPTKTFEQLSPCLTQKKTRHL